MTTVRDYVRQKAQLPLLLVFVGAAGIGLTLGYLRGTGWEWLAIASGLLVLVAIVLIHVNVNCPRCHMPFRTALNWVLFNYGGMGFRYCPNCGCKLDDPL